MHRVGVGEDVADDGVAGFVIGGNLALVVVHDFGLSFGSNGDALKSFGEVAVSDGLVAKAGGGDGGFVGNVGKVGTGRAGGFSSEGFEVETGVDRFALEVDFEDF